MTGKKIIGRFRNAVNMSKEVGRPEAWHNKHGYNYSLEGPIKITAEKKTFRKFHTNRVVGLGFVSTLGISNETPLKSFIFHN